MALILTTDLKLAFFGLSKQLLDGNAHFFVIWRLKTKIFQNLIIYNILILII